MILARESVSLTEETLSATNSDVPPVTPVLVVDDEPAARKLLSLIFGPPAFRCVTAGSGEEALVALQRERFDVVVSDLCMPGIDGMALIAEARRRQPHVAFLVTTGVDDVEIGVRAM